MDAYKINSQQFSAMTFSSASPEIEHFLAENGCTLFRVTETDIQQGKMLRDTVLVVIVDNVGSSAQIVSLFDRIPDVFCVGIFCGSRDAIDAAIINRCNCFIFWPDDQRALLSVIQSIRQKRCYLFSNSALEAWKDEKDFNIIGSSPRFAEVLRRIKVFAACDAPVLIEGETGTGKEVIARAIHYYSLRHAEGFIPVNCGALPDNLVENELFGHEKGAYTDAKNNYRGVVAQANHGTLFLDEIESLTVKAQVTLLRFLQEREYRPLGSLKPLQADVRILAASNESVDKLVRNGVLRQDLLYRLNILSVKLPPLRDRQEDLIPLAEFFLRRLRAQYQKKTKYFSGQLINWIRTYAWPGNVRELENLLHRAFLVSQQDEIQLADLADAEPLYDENVIDEEVLCEISFNAAKSKAIDQFEKQYLCRLMEKSNGNVTLAAKTANKERRALGRLLKKHGIDKTRFMPEKNS